MDLTQQSSASTAAPSEGLGRHIGTFALHFMQMCAVMCVGAFVVAGAVFGLFALLGFGSLLERAPVVAALVVGAGLAVPMAIWMRRMGMTRRLTGEMAAPPIAVCVALIGMYAAGAIGKDALVETQARLACPVMLAVMLIRFRHYSEGHHTAQSAHPAHT